MLSAAEELPALYRALLDRVAQVEGQGRRAAAYRLRSSATKIYSRSWDERARRAMRELLNRSLDERFGVPDEGHEPRHKQVRAT